MSGLMGNNKLLDCITFFDNNFMFKFRYNIYIKENRKNYLVYEI